MSVLTRLVSRRPKQLALRWDTIAASDTGAHPGRVAELTAARQDGITITGVFSQEEIDRALERLDGVERLERPFGTLLGMPLGMLGSDEQDRTPYYEDTVRARALYLDAFGFDPHDRVASILQPMAGTLRLEPPTEDGHGYNPGQIRWWEPNQGGLPAHVGNEFRRQLADGPMSHLVQVTHVTNHLSYFVILQRADTGGELSVYDLTWDDNSGPDNFTNAQRDDSWIDRTVCTKLDLQPGDMVLFGGGWRWHKVDPIFGSKPRISYGGFAAPSVDGEALHFWA